MIVSGAGLGMGIGIAPNAGVGTVPLNNTNPPATRGRTGNTGTQTGYAARGPAIAGYTWEGPPPSTNTRTQPTASTSTASTSTSAAVASTRDRRRDSNNTAAAVSTQRNFGRGLTERIRQIGATGERAPVTATFMQTMGLQPPAPSVIAPSDPNTVRPRAWDRLFGGRDSSPNPTIPGTMNTSTFAETVEPRPRPSRSSSGPDAVSLELTGVSVDEGEQGRPYLTSTTRGAVTPSTDLPGMVRNNLVLAQPGSSMASNNAVSMRIASSSGAEGNARATNAYPPGTANGNRPGLSMRSSSASASLTMLDPSNATGSMWNAYAGEESRETE